MGRQRQQQQQQQQKYSKSKEDVVNELYKPARKKFKRRRTIVKGFDDLWQIDLAEFQDYAQINNGYKYILVVIDCFSKFLWTKPLKSKCANDVTEAMKSILDGNRQPKNLQSDEGKEFFNSQFKALMQKYKINHYHTYSIIKAAIVERVIRTLKEKLHKLFNLNGSYKWITFLDDVTKNYNNTVHKTIKRKPINVTKENEEDMLQTVFNHPKIAAKRKFQVGDIVRLSKYKHLFEKGYTPKWTTELFKISKIKITNPTTYLLEDREGNPIKGCFYEEELQKTNHPDIYLVEKVLKRKGNKLYVKWLGFDKKHNSWIKTLNIV